MGIGASIFFIAVGAILAFAVNFSNQTIGGMSVSWETVGVILMLVGVLGLVWTLMISSRLRRRNVDVVGQDHIVSQDRVVMRDVNDPLV